MVKQSMSDRAAEWADRFRSGRRAAVSVMFAAGAVPMIGLVGLAVDFGIWNQTNATLSVAANVAALSAVRIAANAQVTNDVNPAGQGTAAGQQWFASEVGLANRIGTMGVTLNGGTFGANVNVTVGPTVQATVGYSGTVPSVFGFALFGLAHYPISGQAVAVVTTAPFLNVYMMLDDSSSMQIGATNSDIITMQELTPCNPVPSLVGSQAPGAFYPTGPNSNVYPSNLAGQAYSAYSISGYDGGIQTPAVALDPPLTYNAFTIGNVTPLTCRGLENDQTDPLYNPPTKPLPVNAGPPCAFACHFDPAPAGTGNDFYGLARSTINKSNQVTLRFDLLKTATNSVITAMQADNISSINNLQVGIYSFSTTTTRAYPDPSCGTGLACEAGGDWTTAHADVGGPASYPNGPDTGIQPSYTPTAGNDGDTNFHQDMLNLQALVTPSGDGTKSTSPRKVLFLVTDGMSDTSVNRAYSPVDPADCTLFKSMGFTVYVVFTPYYPVMNGFYVTNIKPIAEPLVGSQLYTAMQACASTPQDFISASDGATLTAALQTFLKQALNTPARFTM